VDLVANRAYSAENLEDALDRIVLMIQELQELGERCIKHSMADGPQATVTAESIEEYIDDQLTEGTHFATIKAHGTVSSGTETLDFDDGSYHTLTAGGDFTIDFDNWPSGKMSMITLKITDGGAHTITWPAAMDWPHGIEPLLTASGTDIMVFFTDDDGTTIYGSISMDDVG